jgi:hypothetical protein
MRVKLQLVMCSDDGREEEAKKHNFKVIVDKSMLAFKRDEEEEHSSSKRFGFAQALDTKSKRRLYEVL